MRDEGANYRPDHIGYAVENCDAKTNDREDFGRSSFRSSTAGETTQPGGDGTEDAGGSGPEEHDGQHG